MLVEMAVADAYAIPFEFVDHTPDRENDLSQFYQHPTYAELNPGQFTDDTQRALGNIQVLMGDYADKFSAWQYAAKYLDVYKYDPREGYSRRYQAFLDSQESALGFGRHVKRQAVSNGSLMGVAPLGFIGNINELKLAATVQAITTHHPNTAIYAQIVALAAHYFIHDVGPRVGVRNFVLMTADWQDNSDDQYRFRYLIDNVGSKKTTIKAASIAAYVIYALDTFDTLSEIMLDAVQRGGDTDSAAASAVAVASCCPYIENDIPQHLIDGLEPNGEFKADRLREIEQRLRERYLP